MFKSVWYTYNINERICQWSLFVLSLGAGMAPSPKHSQDVKQLERVCRTNDPIMVLDKSALWR